MPDALLFSLQVIVHNLFKSTVMRKNYFPPIAGVVSVNTFIIAASGESPRRRGATDFDDVDDDSGGNSWDIWSKIK